MKTHLHNLNNITLQASANPQSAIVVSDASIKNQVATLIAHIHIHDNPVIKMIHHAINITTTEAELFTIRCGINQATCLPNISQIIVISDSIYTAKRIFDSLSHPYQLHTSTISSELREFFIRNHNNSIKFWNCSSHCKWALYNIVDKETKMFTLISISSCRSSWDFSRKNKCDHILNSWKMSFQASDDKGQHFLELLDSDSKPIKMSYSKGGLWLKFFGHSNSLCTRVSRAISIMLL